MPLIKSPTGTLSLPSTNGPLSRPPPSIPLPSPQTTGKAIGSILGTVIDLIQDSKKKGTKALPAPSKDKNTPSYAGDPGLMNSIPSLDNSGYYYTPAYSYSSEPWGPQLVDTFRGSGLMDPFFL